MSHQESGWNPYSNNNIWYISNQVETSAAASSSSVWGLCDGPLFKISFCVHSFLTRLSLCFWIGADQSDLIKSKTLVQAQRQSLSFLLLLLYSSF